MGEDFRIRRSTLEMITFSSSSQQCPLEPRLSLKLQSWACWGSCEDWWPQPSAGQGSLTMMHFMVKSEPNPNWALNLDCRTETKSIVHDLVRVPSQAFPRPVPSLIYALANKSYSRKEQTVCIPSSSPFSPPLLPFLPFLLCSLLAHFFPFLSPFLAFSLLLCLLPFSSSLPSCLSPSLYSFLSHSFFILLNFQSTPFSTVQEIFQEQLDKLHRQHF